MQNRYMNADHRGPRGGGRLLNKEFYIYSSNVAALAVAAVVTDNIPIQADTDFVLEKLTFHADIAGAALTDSSRVTPNVSILITDTGSNRQLMDASVPLTTFFGTGEIPFILPQPRVFSANSVIQVQYTSFEAVNTPDIFLAFIGHKVYRAG